MQRSSSCTTSWTSGRQKAGSSGASCGSAELRSVVAAGVECVPNSDTDAPPRRSRRPGRPSRFLAPDSDMTAKYEWTEDELNVLEQRKLTRHGTTGIDYFWRVWRARDELDQRYYVKSVETETFEIKALRKMLSLRSPRNPTIPMEIAECSGSCVLVMPALVESSVIRWDSLDWQALLDVLHRIIQGVEFLHDNNVAFIDLSCSNVVFSYDASSYGGFHVPARGVYFIDFGSARVLPSGPGSGIVIHDWEEAGGKLPPPEGTGIVDPYAYDIFALGNTLRGTCGSAAYLNKSIRIPPCLTHFNETLRASVPSQRPSIHRVARLFRVLRLWMAATNWTYSIFSHNHADALVDCGWKAISALVY